jgi:hypothetical protein
MLLSPLRSALASAVRSPLEAGRRVLAAIGLLTLDDQPLTLGDEPLTLEQQNGNA